MKLFIDSADIGEIKTAWEWGIIDGVTSNPSLVSKTGRQFKDFIRDVFEIVDGPVSLEVVATDTDSMLREGRKLASLHRNAVVKVPCTVDGIRACSTLSREGVRVNVTLVFSVAQALLAAKAGAYFISPFAGRLDDRGQDGVGVVRDILTVLRNYESNSQVLFASVRSVDHVTKAALMGSHVATVPFKILEQLFQHELTATGLATFLADWQSAGQEPLI